MYLKKKKKKKIIMSEYNSLISSLYGHYFENGNLKKKTATESNCVVIICLFKLKRKMLGYR